MDDKMKSQKTLIIFAGGRERERACSKIMFFICFSLKLMKNLTVNGHNIINKH